MKYILHAVGFLMVASFLVGVLALDTAELYANSENEKPEVPQCVFEFEDGRTIVYFDGEKIRSEQSEANAFTGPESVSISAGTYKVSLMSWDGYINRVNALQPNEQWFARLQYNGSQIVDSSEVSDLADNVIQATLAEVVDETLVVPSDVNEVIAYHAYYPDESNPNSVVPICAAFDVLEEPEPEEPAKIVAFKIVCDDESFLPNWGTGGSDITAVTAEDFVNENNDHCWFEEGWDFEWGYQDVSNPGDGLYGEAGNGWNTFGPTDEDGMTMIEISDLEGSSYLWMREVLKGGFIPFSFGPSGGSNVDEFSAEMYCNTDVLNYDNFDRVDGIALGEIFYCVAFNTLIPEPEVPYAPYCGDEEVNQVWEQCDGGLGCTDQCQFEENNQCTDLVLGKVNVDNVLNWGAGNATSDIFLGSDSNKIPTGRWFLLHFNEIFATDPDISGYEDVPGLAVERQAGTIRTLLYGSHSQREAVNKEHIDGNVEVWNTTVESQTNDTSDNNKYERPTDGSMSFSAGNDEFWLVEGEDTKSYFWTTVTTADDSFFTNYGEVPMCKDENQKPVITLVGSSTVIVNLNETYTEDGATVEDPEDGDITGKLVIGGDIVDTSATSTYIVTYNATDTANVAADVVIRTVNVIEDITPPPPLTECADGEDNDGDGKIDEADPACHTDGDVENPGSYDPNIDSENSKPVITRIGDDPIELTVGDLFVDPEATVTDDEDGDITGKLVIGGDIVDPDTVGTYIITYNATDTVNAAADEVTRGVLVSFPPEDGDGDGDGSSVTPAAGGGGGGGGPISNPLKIINEQIQIISPGSALITWDTNKPATSRVVYDTEQQTVSVGNLNFGTGDKNLNYAFSTTEDKTLTMAHQVLVTSADLDALHYFRPISEDGTRAIGNELAALLSQTQVSLKACSQYLFEFIRFGAENNSEEVLKLQRFLNDFEGESLELTGVYDDATFTAIVAFQNKYQGDVLSPWGLDNDTGYVYLTTRRKINELYCNNQLPFPLTSNQQDEVDQFRTLLDSLRQSGEPLPDTSNVGRGGPEASPDAVLVEEVPDDTLAGDDIDGDDSLAAAIEATAGERGNFLGRLLRGLGGLLRGVFGR